MLDEELMSLVNASLQLVERVDTGDVIERIINEATGVVAAESCALILLEEGGRECYFYAATGPKQNKLRKTRFDARLGIAGKVLRTGEPAVVDDVSEDPEHYKGVDKKTGFHTRSLIAVPLLSGGEVIGVLEAVNSTRSEAFTSRDLNLLTLFANFAGAAIQNSRVFERTRLEAHAFRSAAQRGRVFTGKSIAMRRVWEIAARVAGVDCTVLLTGHSGTGKEVVASYIHARSPRREKPFISINCGALEENLLNSELFGHEKGAFTGAVERRIGRFELAHTGTLFLDEIGECAAATQARLLRVLQEQSFERLGGTETIHTDARIISATNADLTERMKAGLFREDVYHRLNVVNINVPPLRERREDIAGFLDHFIKELREEFRREKVRFSPAVIRLLEDYPWPGNIRELRNFIERVLVLHEGGVVKPEDLPAYLPSISGAPEPPVERRSTAAGLWDSEKQMIEDALRANVGNQSAAARTLGISRHHLRYRIKKYGIRI